MNSPEALLALGLKRGESRGGLICPRCAGGKSVDKSFSVSVSTDGTILYHCFRASCGYSGRTRSAALDDNQVGGGPKRMYPTAPEPRGALDSATRAKLGALYSLTEGTLNDFGVKQHEDRYCVPIYNSTMGDSMGWEYRLLPPYQKDRPKTKSYRPNVDGHLWIGVFKNWQSTNKDIVPLFIVEDTVSAMKITQVNEGDAVSLMGTHMSLDVAHYISGMARGRVYLCLDRDATEKAINYKRKYSMLFEDLVVVPLKDDIKYLNKPEFEELIAKARV